MKELIQERLYPEIDSEIYDTIFLASAVGNKANALTKWLCQRYLAGDFGKDETNAKISIEYIGLAYLRYKHKLGPIMNYKNFRDLEFAIDKVNNSGYHSRGDIEKAARNGADRIYEDDDFLILKINHWLAARKYGAHTRWCISNRSEPETFDSYNENDNVYFIIDKKIKGAKYACVDRVVYDEYDTIILVLPFNEKNFQADIDGQIADPGELSCRIDEHPQLINAIQIAMPKFDKKFVRNTILRTCEAYYVPQDKDEFAGD